MQLPWASVFLCVARMKIQAAYLRTFFSHLHGSDLTPESHGEVLLRVKIKRPPAQAACVILRNNYGFFGVGAGRAGAVAGRVAVPAAPAGLVAGVVAPDGLVLL